MKSAICFKCKKKNEVVEYIVQAKANQEMQKTENAYLDHFNKSIGKPSPTGPSQGQSGYKSGLPSN